MQKRAVGNFKCCTHMIRKGYKKRIAKRKKYGIWRKNGGKSENIVKTKQPIMRNLKP